MERHRISVCTTATLRPALLDRTYRSFFKKVEDAKQKNLVLYINIDPLPINECDPMELVQVAKRYFNKVVYNCPSTANFCSAINWLWSSAQTDYVFHLEDDWQFLRGLRLQRMIEILESHPKVYQLRLKKPANMKWLYGLSPCLIRKNFYKRLAGKLDETMNPERQLRDISHLGLKPHSNRTVIKWPDRPIVVDTGRNWREKKGMSKQKYEIDFIAWEYRKDILR